MDRNVIAAVLAPALLLYACDRAVLPEPGESAAVAEASTTSKAGNTPAPTQPAVVSEAERGETGARDVLLGFARAIERERFDEAWAMLSAADRAKVSKAAFRGQFADLGTITVAIPSGTMEGAAGSSYYTAPISITATDKTGRPIRYDGEAVLRRVNDVEGASPSQLRWRFDRLTLDWTH